jgi:hypothetical protein
MLRAHCRDAFGRAAAREFVQRQRPCGLSWISSGSAGQDPAATCPGLASYSRITESRAGIHRQPATDFRARCDQGDRRSDAVRHTRKALARFGVPTWLPSTGHGQPNRRGCAAPGYARGPQGTSFQPHRKLRCSALPKLARRSSIHRNTSYIARDPSTQVLGTQNRELPQMPCSEL